MRAIYFGANYCGTCYRLRRDVIDPLIAEGCDITPLDAMRYPDLALKNNVTKVPTIIFDGGGRLVQGEITKAAVRERFGN